MKRVILLFFCVCITVLSFSQTPEKMSYQAVVRDARNRLVATTRVGMQISILQGSADGNTIYSEVQTPVTNDNGLVSIIIGTGEGFNAIDWSSGPYFIKTEIDPTGGSSYSITGVTQLLSVPYAMHAKSAESITGGIQETDPIYSSSVASGVTSADTVYWNSKLDSYTETDPVFGASAAAGIQSSDITLWNRKPLINYIGGNQNFQVTATGDYDNVRSVSLTVPCDGVCMVTASGYVDWESVNFDVVRLGLLCDKDPNSDYSAVTEWFSYLNILTDYNCADSSDQYTSFSQHRCFAVTAGTHTFTLWANKYSTSVKVKLGDVNLSAIFIPSAIVASTKSESSPMIKQEAIKPESIVVPVKNPESISGD